MENVKGIIFDYGGTIDSNSRHWSEVIWEKYCELNVPITKEQFREAYVYGERTLAKFPLIKPYYNYLELMKVKLAIETEYLAKEEYWKVADSDRLEIAYDIAKRCNDFAIVTTTRSKTVIDLLSQKYPLELVSNFYGNIHAILDDYDLERFFKGVIESAVVGVRKPDPRIYELGVEALNLKPEEVVVVGDSFKKDILPAKSIGCKTVWIKGEGWDDEQFDESVPDVVITDLMDILPHFGVTIK